MERPTLGKGRIDGSPAARLMASQRLILEAVKTEEAEHQEGSRDGEVQRGGSGEAARERWRGWGAWRRLCPVPSVSR